LKSTVFLILFFISSLSFADIADESRKQEYNYTKDNLIPVLVKYSNKLKGVELFYTDEYNNTKRFIPYIDSLAYHEKEYYITKCKMPDGKIILLNQKINLSIDNYSSGHIVLKFKEISSDTVKYDFEYKEIPYNFKYEVRKQEIHAPIWISVFSLCCFLIWIFYKRRKGDQQTS
jgi:hypothetical protein